MLTNPGLDRTSAYHQGILGGLGLAEVIPSSSVEQPDVMRD